MIRRYPTRDDLRTKLAGPAMPAEMIYLYRWHSEIRRRSGGGFGPGPITWEAIDAWSRINRRVLTPWEAGIIGDLDDKFLLVMSESKPDGK